MKSIFEPTDVIQKFVPGACNRSRLLLYGSRFSFEDGFPSSTRAPPSLAGGRRYSLQPRRIDRSGESRTMAPREPSRDGARKTAALSLLERFKAREYFRLGAFS
jgi:hypothetical protein